MTVAERIHLIRLMEDMEKSENTKRNEDGSLSWCDENGNELLRAKMIRKDEA